MKKIIVLALSIIMLLSVGCSAAVSVVGANINEDGHLVLSMSDGSTIDAGYAKGDKGDQGDIGPQGPQGPQGIQGPQGEVGPQGPKGERGPQGEKGDTGAAGRDGVDGKDGTDGKDGASGAAGQTPYIGENGNWWIGSEDTGIKAEAKEEFIFDKGGNGTILLAYVGTNDSVVIPEKTTGIAKYAFRNNDSIRTVYIPSNVEYIDEYAFADCTGLKIVTFDNDNTYENPHDAAIISIGAFDNCRSLTNVILGSGVQYIDDEAFYFCESLSSINLDNVRYIGAHTFWQCNSLSGKLSTAAYNIGDCAFGWTNYEEATFTCTDAWVTTQSGITPRWGQSIFFGADNLERVTICLETPPECNYPSSIAPGHFMIGYEVKSINVPAASVNSYKAANGWAYYADIFQPIS